MLTSRRASPVRSHYQNSREAGVSKDMSAKRRRIKLWRNQSELDIFTAEVTFTKPKSHPDHKTLYEALKVYIELENKEEFNEAMAMSRKKRHDDRDPPPPPLKDSERSKKKNHDSDASASKQPPPANKDPIPEDVHLLELEDTGAAHLPKIKTRPNWLKPIPEEETPETLEPDWKKMMRETEVHKFSDGTLTRIPEKLDYMIKYYELFKFSLGMERRIWTEDDKQRSQEFIKLIERRLKIRQIFKSLKSFVSGRLRDIDYRLIQRTE
ncbi:hypothetical protein Tco_1001108 [Tanacetum coccineum]